MLTHKQNERGPTAGNETKKKHISCSRNYVMYSSIVGDKVEKKQHCPGKCMLMVSATRKHYSEDLLHVSRKVFPDEFIFLF